MELSNRFRNFFFCMVPMLACIAIQNGAMIFGSQVYLIVMFIRIGMGHEIRLDTQYLQGLMSTPWLMGMYLGYGIIGTVVFLLWYRSIRRREALAGDPEMHSGGWGAQMTSRTGYPEGAQTTGRTEASGRRESLRGYPPYMIGGILLFAVGAQYVCAYIMAISAHARPDWLDAYNRIMESLDISGNQWAILTVLYTVVFGPVCEELCFRGLTMRYALGVMRPMTANIVQAMFFGGMHANPLQSVYAAVFGFLMGMLYLETDNLWITVIVHVLFNAIAMSLGSYIGTGTTPVSFYCILLISLMAVYTGFLLIQRADRERESRVVDQV